MCQGRGPLAKGPDQEGPGPRCPGESRLPEPVRPLPGRDAPSRGWTRPGVVRTWPRTLMGSRRPWLPPYTHTHRPSPQEQRTRGADHGGGRSVGSQQRGFQSPPLMRCARSASPALPAGTAVLSAWDPPLPSGTSPTSALLRGQGGHRPPRGEAGMGQTARGLEGPQSHVCLCVRLGTPSPLRRWWEEGVRGSPVPPGRW